MSVLQQLPPVISPGNPRLGYNSHISSPSRMHIHIDMSAQENYLARSHAQGGIHIDTSFGDGGAYSAGPAPTTVYSSPELPSAISSFNPPATTDSSLLTPISGANSPPLHQRSDKSMHAFGAPVTSGAQQHPSPMVSTEIYFTAASSYPGHTTSGSGSPMTVATHSDMGYPSMGGSPKEEPLTQAGTPYYGAFGVSATTDMDGYHHNQYPNYVNPSEVNQGYFDTAGRGPSNSHLMQRGLPSTAGHGPGPVLAQAPPNHYPSPRPHIENIFPPTPFRSGQNNAVRRTKQSPKGRKPARSNKVHKSNKERSISQGADTGPFDPNAPRLILSDKATEEEKYVFELRNRFIGDKGKGMWEQIAKLYTARFGGDNDKAMLQMKVSRAVTRWGIWPKEEADILLKAFQEDETARIDRILERMKNLDGCRAWDWKARHIEAELVKQGLMEPVMAEDTKIRRRQRTEQRKRSRSQQQQQEALGHLYFMQQQHSQHGHSLHHHPNGLQHHPAEMHSQLTAEQEDELVHQLDRKYGPTDEGSPRALSIHDVHHHNSIESDHDVTSMSRWKSGVAPTTL